MNTIEQQRLPACIVDDIRKWQDLMRNTIETEYKTIVTSEEYTAFVYFCATEYMGNLAYKDHFNELATPLTKD